MKRSISLLLVLLILAGCGQKVITPVADGSENHAAPAETILHTSVPSKAPMTPSPTETPRPALPAYAPKAEPEALFAEELLSWDGEPIGSEFRSLLTAEAISKTEFQDRFNTIIKLLHGLDESVLRLSDGGRTLTEDRRDKTADTLQGLMGGDMLDALRAAYQKCAGDGQDLPVEEFARSMDALLRDVQRMEGRTVPFWGLGSDAAKEYLSVLNRYMGESVTPQSLFADLEALMQTEAYALGAALDADPEAARKKVPVSFGSYEENIAFLRQVTQEICPLPEGDDLPIPPESEGMGEMSILELAFRQYPGMAFLNVYAAQGSKEQQARWENAPEGYLAGLAVHGSYSVVPYLETFGLDYVQYRWYEDMLYATMTGMSALLIHYYGYSEKDLADYLKGWGAEEYAAYLYEKAMFDPFESLVASYGYYRYLDICQAAQDAGCESEERFFRDYLATGPAPFEALKEYMVAFYQNQG